MTVSDSLGAADRAKRAEQVRAEGPVGGSTATARRYDCCTVSGRADGLRAATLAVRRGELVVLPRDTVYGIGADTFNPVAVDSLPQPRGRGRAMPSPVLVASQDALHELVTDFPPRQAGLWWRCCGRAGSSSSAATGHP